MRLLLTGATGFVGRAFGPSVAPGDTIVQLGRRPQGDGLFLEADIGDRAAVDRASRTVSGDFDALVHLAAHVPRVPADDTLRTATEVNVDGFVNVVEAFAGRIGQVVLGSTAEVYDQAGIRGPLPEAWPANPRSYYAATKLAAEAIGLAFGRRAGLAVTALRFSVMYGPGDPIARALPNFIRAALRNEPIAVGGGHLLRDFVHRNDVVDSIHRALEADYTGVVNVGTGTGVSILTAARAVVEAAGSRSEVSCVAGGGGADIVLDPARGRELLGFEAKLRFPDQLDAMVASYRAVPG